MREFVDTDELKGAKFSGADLSGAQFRNVNLAGVKMVDAFLMNAHLSGMIEGLTVNDIEVAPLIVEEMKRRYPERSKLFADDPEGMREGWSLVERMWDETLDRARRLPEERLHERVDEEWSFVETLRHLIFATDAWFGRVVLGEAAPYDPIGLPPSFVTDLEELGIDADAKPSLDETLAVRRDRMDRVRDHIGRLTPEELERTCPRNEVSGYPPDTNVRVIDCLWTVIDEEWAHHRYASRDLERL
jgi:DinB superfamily/Pentapeptide repeats (8 copies)